MNYSANEFVANLRVNKNKTKASKFFEYKTKITGKTAANSRILIREVVAPLKYLIIFRKSLDLPLINWETELHLSCSKDCIISQILSNAEVPANLAADPPIAHLPERSTIDATF